MTQVLVCRLQCAKETSNYLKTLECLQYEHFHHIGTHRYAFGKE